MKLQLGLLIVLFFGVSVTAFAMKEARVTIGTPSGVLIGDVDANSAVIWSRADRESLMKVRLTGGPATADRHFVEVSNKTDFTAKVQFYELRPDTEYTYHVEFLPKSGTRDRVSRSEKIKGTFRTAPQMSDAASIRFAWGGDLAGQNVCRDLVRGFPIFKVLNQEKLDFFIGLGDMIYADGICDPVGQFGNQQVAGNFTPSADLQTFWAHWVYNHDDPESKKFLGKTPYIAIWDDHEVVNDFGPLHDTRNIPPYTPGEHLLPIGLQAFLDYNPIVIPEITPNRLYRSIRWGKHAELFILDTRQYRDANFIDDRTDAPKSMLGREQVAWLKEKLAHSDATWKIIISSVPMSIPTGFPVENGRDGWANFDQDGGFENELLDILRHMHGLGIKNNLWLTTDVHFAEGFSYVPFTDAPDFEIHEFVSGPMNAGLFPSEAFDETLNPKRLFFHGSNTTDYETALDFFNFGAVEINSQGDLTVSIINARGSKVFEKEFSAK